MHEALPLDVRVPRVAREGLELVHAHGVDHERLAAYQRAWQAYYGEYPDPLPVSVRAGLHAEDNVKLNYARLIVDKGVHALFAQPPTFDLDSRPGERSLADLIAARGAYFRLYTMQWAATPDRAVSSAPR